MAYLHNFVELQFLRNVGVCLPGIQTSYSAKIRQFIVADIGPVLLCEEIGVDPIPASLGKDDGPGLVFAQALLEDSAAQIVSLPQHHLTDGRAKLGIRNARLSCSLVKPSSFENPFRSCIRVGHIHNIAPGAIDDQFPGAADSPPAIR